MRTATATGTETRQVSAYRCREWFGGVTSWRPPSTPGPGRSRRRRRRNHLIICGGTPDGDGSSLTLHAPGRAALRLCLPVDRAPEPFRRVGRVELPDFDRLQRVEHRVG